MTDDSRFKVTDKRRAATPPDAGDAASEAGIPEAEIVEDPSNELLSDVPSEADLLNKLTYLQADFDNYRKRMMREQAEMTKRAEARLIERLLPVVDNFDRALQHEPEGSSLGILYRELMEALKADGLKEIAALGAEFDPRFHEAVESHEDGSVAVPTVSSVHRRGFMFADGVLRPAMVAVARPVEDIQVDNPREAEG